MAAIVPFATTGAFVIVRNAVAQANTGQTDWLLVPQWATFCTVHLNITATAGTTPGPSTLSIKSAMQVGIDDTNAQTMSAGSAIAVNGGQVVDIGPGVTGIADAGSATKVTVNAILPAILGLTLLLDRTNADETYTYTLSARFKP